MDLASVSVRGLAPREAHEQLRGVLEEVLLLNRLLVQGVIVQGGPEVIGLDLCACETLRSGRCARHGEVGARAGAPCHWADPMWPRRPACAASA